MAKPRKRRQRPHGALPAGFRWRESRPRWEPSPARRSAGWKGCDLKDAWGRWLARGPAIERAQALADAVAAWARGVAVPAVFADLAPAGATQIDDAPRGGRLNPRSIGALLDAYLASPAFSRLGERTQGDYRNKLSRFLAVLGGDTPAKLAKLRALDIDGLLPPAFGEARAFQLKVAYRALRDSAGVSMAAGVHACVSAWLGWCVEEKHTWPTNPALLVKRETPEGRIVTYTWPELIALVRAADQSNDPSIGDAIILGLDLSWSQQDLLSLTWSQISDDGHVKHRRIKTGNAGNPPLLRFGRERIEAIRERWRGAAVRPVHVLVCASTGRPWLADHFRHAFAEIRGLAAADCPGLADKQFRDLRDTAVTYGIEAGLTLEEVCSRTLHAPSRAQKVIEKHYGAIRQSVADAGGAKLEAHFERMGLRF